MSMRIDEAKLAKFEESPSEKGAISRGTAHKILGETQLEKHKVKIGKDSITFWTGAMQIKDRSGKVQTVNVEILARTTKKALQWIQSTRRTTLEFNDLNTIKGATLQFKKAQNSMSFGRPQFHPLVYKEGQWQMMVPKDYSAFASKLVPLDAGKKQTAVDLGQAIVGIDGFNGEGVGSRLLEAFKTGSLKAFGKALGEGLLEIARPNWQGDQSLKENMKLLAKAYARRLVFAGLAAGLVAGITPVPIFAPNLSATAQAGRFLLATGVIYGTGSFIYGATRQNRFKEIGADFVRKAVVGTVVKWGGQSMMYMLYNKMATSLSGQIGCPLPKIRTYGDDLDDQVEAIETYADIKASKP